MSAKQAITEANLRVVREAIAGSKNGVVEPPGNLTITLAEAIAYRDGLQATLDHLSDRADYARHVGGGIYL